MQLLLCDHETGDFFLMYYIKQLYKGHTALKRPYWQPTTLY